MRNKHRLVSLGFSAGGSEERGKQQEFGFSGLGDSGRLVDKQRR